MTTWTDVSLFPVSVIRRLLILDLCYVRIIVKELRRWFDRTVNHPLLVCPATKSISEIYFLVGSTCGAEEDRTPDPLLAKQVLYQLSYGPNSEKSWSTWRATIISIFAKHKRQQQQR